MLVIPYMYERIIHSPHSGVSSVNAISSPILWRLIIDPPNRDQITRMCSNAKGILQAIETALIVNGRNEKSFETNLAKRSKNH